MSQKGTKLKWSSRVIEGTDCGSRFILGHYCSHERNEAHYMVNYCEVRNEKNVARI